jgi:hypothetical protein
MGCGVSVVRNEGVVVDHLTDHDRAVVRFDTSRFKLRRSRVTDRANG